MRRVGLLVGEDDFTNGSCKSFLFRENVSVSGRRPPDLTEILSTTKINDNWKLAFVSALGFVEASCKCSIGE